MYYLYLLHSEHNLTTEQKEGNSHLAVCKTCSKRFVKDPTRYYKYNKRKGNSGNSVQTTFKWKEDLLEELRRRCIMRKCKCTFSFEGGKIWKNGFPEKQLCKGCYQIYFVDREPKNEEAWENAEKKDFQCTRCRAPFDYEEDLDYHCTICEYGDLHRVGDEANFDGNEDGGEQATNGEVSERV